MRRWWFDSRGDQVTWRSGAHNGFRSTQWVQEHTMGIDLAMVNWVFVVVMAALAFVAALLGNLIAFRNRFVAAIIAGVLFAAFFVAWNYYPHNFGLPIIKTIGTDGGAG